MYLKHIKLAGFKSFVDPTTIPFGRVLNAIVGPNGCGKSNVVDAIRWVVGEISAKQLRGQSMTDVIFNGTSGRQPVGKAAVEMLFDNSDGRIGGEFASYSELAIRREVGREGQSDYFINGTPCRRRDILDIFLGTGFGPRSYAIIEQGMISKLIEAKPEDLRVYIEEAAGVSKYKERRRETENRIRHTQDNLDRLSDVREELEKQLARLKRQANAAERYQELKQEERKLSAQMKALQWKALGQQLMSQDRLVAEQGILYEQQQAELRETETQIERTRQAQYETTEAQNQAQKNYYGLGAEIAKLEQQIQHTEAQIVRWQQELSEAESLWEEINDNSTEHQQQIQALEHELNQWSPQSESVYREAADAQHLLAQSEQAMQRWQQEWDHFQEELSHVHSQKEVAKTKTEHTENDLTNLQQRRDQLQQQFQSINLTQLQQSISPLNEKTAHINQELNVVKEQLQNYVQKIQQQRELNYQELKSLQQLQQELQAKTGRYASLEALQQSALGQDNQATHAWLQKQSLSQAARLSQQLTVKAGWEVAVETVLSGYFDAVQVDAIHPFIDQMGQWDQGCITLFEKSNHSISASSKGATLADQVNRDCPFYAWLSTVYVADNISDAQKLRTQLAAHESVMTREGLWMGPNWVRYAKASDTQSGILLREQQLRQLREDIHLFEKTLADQEELHRLSEANLAQLEAEREALHQRYQELSAELTKVGALLSAQQAELNSHQQRQQQLQQSIEECEQHIVMAQKTLQDMQINWEALKGHQEDFQQRREHLLTDREQCRVSLDQARVTAQQKQQRADEFAIRLSSNQNQLALLKQTMQRDERQLESLSERRSTLREHLVEENSPLAQYKQQLQEQLARRLTAENELRQVEALLDQHNQRLQQFESKRSETQALLSDLQTKIQELKMERQSITVRQTTIIEQLVEQNQMLETLLAELPETAEFTAWEQELAAVQRRIENLGPINLAAIDEYQEISQRKEYLDKQNNDLVEALTILQEAIKKIDRESKAKFKETFDRVNEGLGKLFPKVFGGGNASLELTEDDFLSTGILVRAQPPGKKNSTIHMLSGGEKALTAISLIFSLFQLNPAPFCVLDEVDAPLDDLNVGRFCHLVKEMSKEVQFIVISHNKVTIESADQLMGVTMQEPGVSRIVSVNMEQAVSMAVA